VNVYWLEQTQEDVPEGDEWLGMHERACLSTLHFPKRRLEWRLGRWTAKCALAAYQRLPLQSDRLARIEICAAPSGAPQVFPGDHLAAMTISISHRSGMSLCAVAEAGVRLGCDVELVESRSEVFLADYFTSEEQHLVADMPAAERARLVTLLWSAKESALKALQVGLRRDTRSVLVEVGGPHTVDGWTSMRVRSIEGDVFQGWWREHNGAVRTLVADQPLTFPISLRSARPCAA
jgi:4'-phosphopantetheinyl transferase EntD